MKRGVCHVSCYTSGMFGDELNTSDMARDAFASLIDVFMPLAQGLIIRDGSFVPFAGYIDATGEAQGLSVNLDDDEAVAPEQIITALEDALKTQASESAVQAAVIFADIYLRPADEPHSDAILGRFEHSDGSAFRLFLRYASTEGGEVVFRDPSGAPEDPMGLTSMRH